MNQFTSDEQALIDVWEAHTASEFEQRDADAAIATMTDRCPSSDKLRQMAV